MHKPTAAAQQAHQLMLQAADYYGRDGYASAAALCERALAISPEIPEALHLLGLCRWKSGANLDGVLQLLQQAAALKPNDAQLWHNLGIVREQSGDLAGAREAFRTAVLCDPARSDSQYNLGVMCTALKEEAAAEQAYRQALATDGRHAGAAAGLAAVCEARNQPEEAGRWLAVALQQDPHDAVANLTQAQLDFRIGHYPQAVTRLQDLLQRPLSAINRSLALGRLGMSYDRLGNYQLAFAAFMQAKQALNQQMWSSPEADLYSPATAARICRQFGLLTGNGPIPAEPKSAVAPVFLLGFPRSGTTLLDQILSCHSRILVLEERETLQDVLQDFAISDRRLEEFAHCDAGLLQDYRDRYWSRVSDFLPQYSAHMLFIDKLPLNTLYLPLIRRLFPAARFILALRDPRDVVLSCFMQSFEPNAAMRNFFSLETTVGFYSAVMQIARLALTSFPEQIHVLRYEALVEDAASETGKLLAFLGLDWEPKVLEFHKTAQGRRIHTPSYHQVAQPIYQAACQRWRHYAQHLQTVLPRLQPFVDYFGYS
ncbi:MAG: sulfotransferase [Gammaproteobacteria bacterium]|nr:sulfotransferase [Gammaproteobacteria bacterium]